MTKFQLSALEMKQSFLMENLLALLQVVPMVTGLVIVSLLPISKLNTAMMERVSLWRLPLALEVVMYR
jgi:hypothetical protein